MIRLLIVLWLVNDTLVAVSGTVVWRLRASDHRGRAARYPGSECLELADLGRIRPPVLLREKRPKSAQIEPFDAPNPVLVMKAFLGTPRLFG